MSAAPRQPLSDLPHFPQHVVQRGNDGRDRSRPVPRRTARHHLASRVRGPCVCVGLDDRPRAPAYHADRDRTGRRRGTGAGASLRSVRQRPLSPHRHSLGGPLKGLPRGQRERPAPLLPLHRTQPVARREVGNTRGVPLVQPCGRCVRAHDPLLEPHPAYVALGTDAPSRQLAYRALVDGELAAYEVEFIWLRLQRQRALGTDRFRTYIEAQLARRATCQDRAAEENRSRGVR